MNRRDFFRRVSGQKRVMRPPGAGEELSFFQKCNGCAECVSACPQYIIQMDGQNRPVVSVLKAGCTFCGRCAEVCTPGALAINDSDQPGWNWRAKVAANCLDKHGIVCRACESVCEENAIRFRPLLAGKCDVSISIEACNGCGACVSVCPSKAIGMVWAETDLIKMKETAA